MDQLPQPPTVREGRRTGGAMRRLLRQIWRDCEDNALNRSYFRTEEICFVVMHIEYIGCASLVFVGQDVRQVQYSYITH